MFLILFFKGEIFL